MKKYLSVTEYAKERGVSRQSVLKKIARKKLKAEKVGATYIIKM